MTLEEWCESFSLLNFDIKKLNKQAKKLNKFYEKRKEKDFNLLLPEVQVNYAYIKALFEKLDDQSYWHQNYINLYAWKKYKEGIAMLFDYFDNIIPSRR